jgi:hypothetical protein
MDNTISAQSTSRTRAGFILFSFALAAFGAVMGGNIYQIVAEVPNWASNIPDSLASYRKFATVSHAGYFFQSLVPFIILSLITATILLRNRPRQANRWLMITLGGVILAEAFTGIYFLPRNFILFLDPIEGVPAEQLIKTGKEWQSANYIRMLMILFTMYAFLRSYRILCTARVDQG